MDVVCLTRRNQTSNTYSWKQRAIKDNFYLRGFKYLFIMKKWLFFKRDNYRCVICGRGKAAGVEIQADHIKPKELGGEAEIENGQTLCAQHNFQKKYYKQTETGKRMFIRLYELAKKNNDKELIDFCE